jgi:ATP-dependent DNA helicase RecG
VLVTDLDTSKTSDDPVVRVAHERLAAVVNTTDGFELALVDLRHRGEGQLFGARQSGMPQLKMTRVLEHQDIAVDVVGTG